MCAIFAYYCANKKLDAQFASSFGSMATGVGIIWAALTVRKMQQGNDFTATATVWSRFNENSSYQARRYLCKSFRIDLANATKNVFGGKSVSSGEADIRWILANVEKSEEKEDALDTELKRVCFGVDKMTALEAAERVLLDSDIIAVPFCAGNSSARLIARAWKPVLTKTSKALLPLVALKTKLRGPTESYKYHYLKLLHDLKIDLRGVDVPNQP
ncbi:MAG: hypothetical protein A2107_11620 [Verrucomicrobia bacterium GWF2_62_7]|nr:MAG: hypothetical protein A2107_11620 [Verrucomicrobia bacterium GWF2_62_7]